MTYSNNRDNRQPVVAQIYDYQNGLLRAKVDRMIDDNETLADIKDFIITMTDGKIQPSIGTVNNYKAKLLQSRKENIDMAELVDKRRKQGDNIVDLKGKEKRALVEQNDSVGEAQAYESPSSRLVSTTQVLEKIIGIGYDTLEDISAIDVGTLLKAVTTYSQITGASNGGLMLSGVQQIALQQKAYESAMGEVIAKYVPESQQEKLWADMELAEQQFYDDLDITKEGKAVKETMEKLGIEL